mmetsp:Transcript_21814/g.64344  ORF Transcript_21814/g.64344 Transcript_21814/m.64344 type:complete len:236 (+) Transcript_21814:383-1090(+)
MSNPWAFMDSSAFASPSFALKVCSMSYNTSTWAATGWSSKLSSVRESSVIGVPSSSSSSRAVFGGSSNARALRSAMFVISPLSALNASRFLSSRRQLVLELCSIESKYSPVTIARSCAASESGSASASFVQLRLISLVDAVTPSASASASASSSSGRSDPPGGRFPSARSRRERRRASASAEPSGLFDEDDASKSTFSRPSAVDELPSPSPSAVAPSSQSPPPPASSCNSSCSAS